MRLVEGSRAEGARHHVAVLDDQATQRRRRLLRSQVVVGGVDDSLLDGSKSVPGLAVDAELRWALLSRLVVLGRAGVDAIVNERDRDDTAAGRRHEQRLRAARPTAEAKEEAWALATEDESLPNAEQSAIIAGFQQPEQRELLRPYVTRYFEVIGPLWDRRTHEMAEQVAVGLFPHQLVDQSVVDITDEYLRTQ
ncbi:MAG TPA: ERAP1-like C-terminal domain-containing protein, partial [Mycobacteriales bacterium]|nr:ERAP1-like C-terminal domain-containing protein [Mycobacteriales bacterium]